MRKLLLTASLVCLSALCYADMTIVEKVQTGAIMGQPAQDGITTIYIKGKKARIEQSTGKNFQILDLQTNMMYIVDTEKKQAMSMSTETLKQAGSMFTAMGGNAKLQIKKTGGAKTINGWNCEEYNLSATGQFGINMNQWLTQDVDTSEFDGFKSFSDGFMRMIGQTSESLPKGMPIRTEGKMTMMGQTVSTTTEVQSIKKDPLADELFVVPAGYEIKDMKGMMPHQ